MRPIAAHRRGVNAIPPVTYTSVVRENTNGHVAKRVDTMVLATLTQSGPFDLPELDMVIWVQPTPLVMLQNTPRGNPNASVCKYCCIT